MPINATCMPHAWRSQTTTALPPHCSRHLTKHKPYGRRNIGNVSIRPCDGHRTSFAASSGGDNTARPGDVSQQPSQPEPPQQSPDDTSVSQIIADVLNEDSASRRQSAVRHCMPAFMHALHGMSMTCMCEQLSRAWRLPPIASGNVHECYDSLVYMHAVQHTLVHQRSRGFSG